ncbi:MAG TPA: cytochrome P450, partial [Novosphingobium sp.]|nr:cytochrome P450 [Novosphingobium sp.]
MATQLAPDAPVTYRTSPTAMESLDQWFRDNPQATPQHTHPWDVSRSDIYVEDRWQPIFAKMRAEAPINKVTGTPFGDYWNVTTLKAIQHVEALPELFSSSWEHGGITIGEPRRELAEEDKFQLPMFIAMDRPQHTGQRRTVAPAFTPAEMERMSTEIRQRTAEVLDSLPW